MATFRYTQFRFAGAEVKLRNVLLFFHKENLIAAQMVDTREIFINEELSTSLGMNARKHISQWRSALEYNHNYLTEQSFEEQVLDMISSQFRPTERTSDHPTHTTERRAVAEPR